VAGGRSPGVCDVVHYWVIDSKSTQELVPVEMDLSKAPHLPAGANQSQAKPVWATKEALGLRFTPGGTPGQVIVAQVVPHGNSQQIYHYYIIRNVVNGKSELLYREYKCFEKSCQSALLERVVDGLFYPTRPVHSHPGANASNALLRHKNQAYAGNKVSARQPSLQKKSVNVPAAARPAEKYSPAVNQLLRQFASYTFYPGEQLGISVVQNKYCVRTPHAVYHFKNYSVVGSGPECYKQFICERGGVKCNARLVEKVATKRFVLLGTHCCLSQPMFQPAPTRTNRTSRNTGRSTRRQKKAVQLKLLGISPAFGTADTVVHMFISTMSNSSVHPFSLNSISISYQNQLLKNSKDRQNILGIYPRKVLKNLKSFPESQFVVSFIIPPPRAASEKTAPKRRSSRRRTKRGNKNSMASQSAPPALQNGIMQIKLIVTRQKKTWWASDTVRFQYIPAVQPGKKRKRSQVAEYELALSRQQSQVQQQQIPVALPLPPPPPPPPVGIGNNGNGLLLQPPPNLFQVLSQAPMAKFRQIMIFGTFPSRIPLSGCDNVDIYCSFYNFVIFKGMHWPMPYVSSSIDVGKIFFGDSIVEGPFSFKYLNEHDISSFRDQEPNSFQLCANSNFVINTRAPPHSQTGFVDLQIECVRIPFSGCLKNAICYYSPEEEAGSDLEKSDWNRIGIQDEDVPDVFQLPDPPFEY